MKKSIKNIIKSTFLLCVIAFCFIMLLFNPQQYIKTTLDGVKLWAITILPSLLPFFFLTNLLTKCGYAFSLSKTLSPLSRILYNSNGIALYIRIMSLLSGYPVGAKLILDLKNKGVISENEGTKYSTFTSTSGPFFIIGSVGVGMLNSSFKGVVILISHTLSSMLVGVIFRGYCKDSEHNNLTCQKVDNILYESVYSSVLSILLIGGYVTIFYTFCSMIKDANLLLPITSLLNNFFDSNLTLGFLLGLIESSFGSIMIAKSHSILVLPLITSIISFGGLSIWCQTIGLLKQAKTNIKIFILSKVLHSLLSFVISLILVLIIL